MPLPWVEFDDGARWKQIRVAEGDVDVGINSLDESMAIAAAGEADDGQSIAEAYCTLMDTAELLGDTDRFEQWTVAIDVLKARHGFGPLDTAGSSLAYGNLSAFCAACCGGMYLVTGRLADAEGELRHAITDLETRGMQSRCVHPVTQLAELRVLQGRYEEARALLESYEDLPEAVRPLAVLDLALGEPESAAARLNQRLADHEDLMVGALPLQTVLVDAHIALGNLDAAVNAVQAIEGVAALTKSKRHAGEALFARGKVLAASGEPEASTALRASAVAFSEAGMALGACRARLALARTLRRHGSSGCDLRGASSAGRVRPIGRDPRRGCGCGFPERARCARQDGPEEPRAVDEARDRGSAPRRERVLQR